MVDKACRGFSLKHSLALHLARASFHTALSSVLGVGSERQYEPAADMASEAGSNLRALFPCGASLNRDVWTGIELGVPASTLLPGVALNPETCTN